MNPIVVVTQDPDGYGIEIQVFESERRFYDRDPMATLKREPAWTGESHRSTVPPAGLLIKELWERVAENPWADVSDLATHCIPEPGAPLEPVPEVAA